VSIRVRFQIERGTFRLGVDLDLPGSGMSSIFGPSGCGKTSLLRAVAGLDRYADGQCVVNGLCWQDGDLFLPPHRRSLGYVFQEPSLFEHLDVRGNIHYGQKRADPEGRRIALDDAVDLLELGGLMERSPSTLSGGERQRVAIARALAVNPRLLLMDEPLSAVDVSRRQEILPYIESLHRELVIPVIHVSHLPGEVAQVADHVVLLGQDGVEASGDVHDLFTRLDLSLAHESRASSLVEARVAGTEAEFGLARLEFEGGQFLVTQGGLRPGRRVRLRVLARDVSLTLERQADTSILNIIETTVQELQGEDEARVLVRLLAGGTLLLASITRKSAHDLALEPGQRVFAQVKSVALLA
jgi:molybdate transport system ATP-binding protein